MLRSLVVVRETFVVGATVDVDKAVVVAVIV